MKNMKKMKKNEENEEKVKMNMRLRDMPGV